MLVLDSSVTRIWYLLVQYFVFHLIQKGASVGKVLFIRFFSKQPYFTAAAGYWNWLKGIEFTILIELMCLAENCFLLIYKKTGFSS